MEQQKKYDVFISYSRKDFDEVNAFVEMLKLRIPTLDIWFDLDGIESGDEFRDKIISAIKRSKYVLFALSSNSDKSEWTRKELGFAKGKGIKIVPILLKGAQLQDMDWFLFEFSGVDCIDIIDTKQIDKLIKNLAKWTQKELATLPPEESQKITAQPKVSSVQNTDSTSANSDKRPPKLKSKQWLWVLAAILLIGALGVLGWNQYEKQQEIIAKQHYQDSVRLVQKQDSIKEFLRKDSIRVAREKQRQDSITKTQTAEKKRLERMRQDSIAKALVLEKSIAAEKKQAEKERKSTKTSSYNGHEYVDLGLSVMWATMNVGAESPEDAGDYFAWGETISKTNYDWSTYKWCNGDLESLTKYNLRISMGSIDKKTELEESDDAANMNWGGIWRMPTDAEWTELLEQCNWAWTTINSVNGYKVMSKRNGNSIFLPAAGFLAGSDDLDSPLKHLGREGHYWSRSLYKEFSGFAKCLIMYSHKPNIFFSNRDCGLSVRAVVDRSRSIQHEALIEQIKAKMKMEALEPLNYSETMRELEKSNTEEKLKRIIAELESYDQLLSDEAEKTAPTFNLR